VEPSSSGSFDTGEPALTFDSTSAVLLLVERSARNFKEVVELLDDVPAAAQVTGASVSSAPEAGAAAEEHVDEYA
jgi:hypothetical protein